MKKSTFTLFTSLLALFSSNLQVSAQEIWGMTSIGGSSGLGVIFKTNALGENQNPVFSFTVDIDGKYPGLNLVQASDGKLYGMTFYGGVSEDGVLFQYDPVANTYTKKIDFNGTNGSNPAGSLIQITNGMIYGMTSSGGANGFGVLFQYDLSTNTYTKKLDFDGIDGSNPNGSLMQASNGKLYGMTYSGGASGYGVLFQYDPGANTYTKKLDFNGTNGSNPYGSLMQASNGILYAMTYNGGANEKGVLFQYDLVTNTYTKILDFDGSNGSNPHGSLMQASDGRLYGLTSGGGSGNGVLFEYDPSTNIYTKKLDFDGTTQGSVPYGSLMQASDGKLYGLTRGDRSSLGVLFQFDPVSNTYTKKLDFNATRGSKPYGSLIQASDGKLYGLTHQDGVGGYGVLFQYEPSTNSYVNKLNFNAAPQGENPNGSLMQAFDGKLYGMTYLGGVSGNGVLFQFDPVSNTFTKILDFNGTNGSYPTESLMQASNGKLYGLTEAGGGGNGVLFEYDPATNIYTKKLDFDGTNGSSPSGSLIQASNGKLYGLTSGGGIGYIPHGVLFEYDPATNIFTKKLDFDGTTQGYAFLGSLMQASNGKLYGMTSRGGLNDDGVLFEYDLVTNAYTKKLDFDWTTLGTAPAGSLIQASDGKLYGMTSGGGLNNDGVLFEYDPVTNIYTKKMDFEMTTLGGNPWGSLMQSTNSKLYGMTSNGGANGHGVLFQYDPVANIYTKKLDFDLTNGAGPGCTSLILVGSYVTQVAVCKNTKFILNAYPNPFTDHLYFELQLNETAIAQIEIFNINGTKLATLFSGDVGADQAYCFDYTPENIRSGILIYRVVIDGKIVFCGKVVHK